jgi:hypothetical protein
MNRIWWPVAVLAAIIAFIGNVIQGNYFSICIDAWILHDLWRDRPDDWDKPFRKAGRWLMHGLQPPATQTA